MQGAPFGKPTCFFGKKEVWFTGDFMANIVDYLAWRGDLSFLNAAFTEVDALVLCQLSYLDFTGIVPADFCNNAPTLQTVAHEFISSKNYEDRCKELGALINPLTIPLLTDAAQTNRFGSLRLCGFVDKIDSEHEEQFSAVTFLGDGFHNCVIFRGTDSTLIGWKEDFNLGYLDTVPAQEDALLYLTRAMNALEGSFIVGGHSKGANLSLFSSAHIPPHLQSRISSIYNNDGPGFKKEFFSFSGYKTVEDRIHSYVPEESVIGMLFCHANNYTTVKSTEKLLKQHDPFSWQVKAVHFEELSGTNKQSRLIGKAVNNWIKDLSLEQRELFIETVFGVLETIEAKTTSDLSANGFDTTVKMIKATSRLDSKTRDAVFKTLQALFKGFTASAKEVYKAPPAQ